MDQPTANFIEQMGLFGLENGLPRSVARVMGYMLVCQPAHQSALEIRTELALSAGAVSNALGLLQRAGLVRRIAISNQRQLHYEIDGDGWYRAIAQRFQSLSRAIELAQEGLLLDPDNTRLKAMRDVYGSFNNEIAAIVAKLEKERHSRKE